MYPHPWHDIDVPDDPATWFPVFIEVPQGTSVVYRLDDVGILRAEHFLEGAMHFPANRGIIPQTLDARNQPLRAYVLGQLPFTVRSWLRSRAIGAVRISHASRDAIDVIAVPLDDPEFQSYRNLFEVPPHRVRNLGQFARELWTLEGLEPRAESF